MYAISELLSAQEDVSMKNQLNSSEWFDESKPLNIYRNH